MERIWGHFGLVQGSTVFWFYLSNGLVIQCQLIPDLAGGRKAQLATVWHPNGVHETAPIDEIDGSAPWKSPDMGISYSGKFNISVSAKNSTLKVVKLSAASEAVNKTGVVVTSMPDSYADDERLYLVHVLPLVRTKESCQFCVTAKSAVQAGSYCDSPTLLFYCGGSLFLSTFSRFLVLSPMTSRACLSQELWYIGLHAREPCHYSRAHVFHGGKPGTAFIRPFEMFTREPTVLSCSLFSGSSDALIFFPLRKALSLSTSNGGSRQHRKDCHLVPSLLATLLAILLFSWFIKIVAKSPRPEPPDPRGGERVRGEAPVPTRLVSQSGTSARRSS